MVQQLPGPDFLCEEADTWQAEEVVWGQLLLGSELQKTVAQAPAPNYQCGIMAALVVGPTAGSQVEKCPSPSGPMGSSPRGPHTQC